MDILNNSTFPVFPPSFQLMLYSRPYSFMAVFPDISRPLLNSRPAPCLLDPAARGLEMVRLGTFIIIIVWVCTVPSWELPSW